MSTLPKATQSATATLILGPRGKIKAEGREAWAAAGTDALNPYDTGWEQEAWQEGYDDARLAEEAP